MAGAATASLAGWAHGLNNTQRNGGDVSVLHGRLPGSGGSALAAPTMLAAALMALGTLIASAGAAMCARDLSRSARG